jgi:hypothetical protein
VSIHGALSGRVMKDEPYVFSPYIVVKPFCEKRSHDSRFGVAL